MLPWLAFHRRRHSIVERVLRHGERHPDSSCFDGAARGRDGVDREAFNDGQRHIHSNNGNIALSKNFDRRIVERFQVLGPGILDRSIRIDRALQP